MNAVQTMLKTLTANTSPEKKIIGIGGSPRRNGNADILLGSALKGAANLGVESSSYHLREIRFQGCIGCERCRKDKICTDLLDGMSMLYQPLLACPHDWQDQV